MQPEFRFLFRRTFAWFLSSCFAVFLISSLPAADSFRPPPEYHPGEGDFLAISNSVIALLQTRDVAAFAREVTASAGDWKSMLSTNLPPTGEDPLKGFNSSAAREREQVAASAKALLAKADALRLDFSKGDWRVRVLTPKHFGSTRYPTLQAEGETVPWAEKLELILESNAGASASTNGEFKLALRSLMKFPAGWRSHEGIQWISFPRNVADDKTLRELVLLQKVAGYKGFNGEDDPALLQLGETLVRFLRERDTGIYEKELLMNSDRVWAMIQKSGRSGPTRQEVDEEIAKHVKEQVRSAQSALQLMADAGVDLKSADVKIEDASVEHGQSQGAGSLDGLMGSQFKLTLAVKTEAKAKNGTPLAGKYVFAVKRLLRQEDHWIVEDDVHWEKLPDGVVDAKTTAAMEFENYVAEHGTLPPISNAPEIEFTTLVGEKKMKLSDLRGKVVILDFWATWCGPCQEPMAELQTLRKNHAGWQDRVAIVPVSIDDTIDVLRKHVDKRGWTNTFNVWAGEGGWRSAPAKAFRVNGVPTTYLIDASGKIVWAGHPSGKDFGKAVDDLLKR